MQSECAQLISNLEESLKNTGNYNRFYLSYSYEENKNKNNLIRYSFYNKKYMCDKNPSDINLQDCNKVDICYKYTSTTGDSGSSGIIIYEKNNNSSNYNCNYRDVPIL
jgi:hypothetical protein